MSYYVLPEVFREELCAGFDYRAVTRLLLAQGWLGYFSTNSLKIYLFACQSYEAPF